MVKDGQWFFVHDDREMGAVSHLERIRFLAAPLQVEKNEGVFFATYQVVDPREDGPFVVFESANVEAVFTFLTGYRYGFRDGARGRRPRPKGLFGVRSKLSRHEDPEDEP